MNPVFIIAEVAQAHDGSLGILHSFIDAVAETGVDAIKFQTHIAKAESSSAEPFRVNFSYEDKTRYDYWERMGFDFEQWQGIKKHCDEVGLEFLSSPFSNEAVDLLEKLNMKKYKIGSGEVTNHLLLEKIKSTGKEVILSSGMSSFDELSSAIKQLGGGKEVPLTILQCTTQYPTPAENVGLNVINDLKSKFNLPVGLSDHSGTIYPALAATALGATMLEVHVAFSKKMFGPDASSSLELEELKKMVEGVRFISESLKNPVDKNNTEKFTDVKKIFEKTLSVNKDLPAGHQITFDDLDAKKPANMGIKASNYKAVIGQKLKSDIKAYSFLKDKHVDNPAG